MKSSIRSGIAPSCEKITGGKLTTWRRMAKLTVDRIVERDGSDARCITHEIPLGMAVAPDDLTAAPVHARAQLAARYGHVAHDVLALAAADGGRDGRGETERGARELSAAREREDACDQVAQHRVGICARHEAVAAAMHRLDEASAPRVVGERAPDLTLFAA